MLSQAQQGGSCTKYTAVQGNTNKDEERHSEAVRRCDINQKHRSFDSIVCNVDEEKIYHPVFHCPWAYSGNVLPSNHGKRGGISAILILMTSYVIGIL